MNKNKDDFSLIENAFSKTTNILFGRKLIDLKSYERWLSRHVPNGRLIKLLDGRELHVPNYAAFKDIPSDRIRGIDYMKDARKLQIDISEKDNLNSISKKLKASSIFVVEVIGGNSLNVIDSTIYSNIYYAYRIFDLIDSKYVSFVFWSDGANHLFGSSRSFNCSYSIHIYNSRNIKTSYEVDYSANCSNSMFLHNCYNVKDSLFCFNTRNKRYAIFNKEVGKEEYERVRKILMDKILSDLKSKKFFEPDIFNLSKIKMK